MSLILHKQNFFARPQQPIVVADRHPQPIFAEHRHDFCELVLVWRGNGLHILNGRPWRITRGDLFYVCAEDCHSYTAVNNLVLQNILYCPERFHWPIPFSELVPDAIASANSRHWRLSQSGIAPIRQVIQHLSQEAASPDTLSQSLAETLFLQLLLLLKRYRYQAECGPATGPGQGVEHLIGAIAADIAKPFALAAFCEQQGVSERKMRQHFMAQTGMTISHYQRQLKICQAQYLLSHTRLKVAEVAMRCGFGDSNYFSVVFARETASTPLQWRQRAAALAGHTQPDHVGRNDNDNTART